MHSSVIAKLNKFPNDFCFGLGFVLLDGSSMRSSSDPE